MSWHGLNLTYVTQPVASEALNPIMSIHPEKPDEKHTPDLNLPVEARKRRLGVVLIGLHTEAWDLLHNNDARSGMLMDGLDQLVIHLCKLVVV